MVKHNSNGGETMHFWQGDEDDDGWDDDFDSDE